MKFSFLLLFAISSTAFARGPAGTFRDFYGPEFHRQPTASSNKNPNVASDVLHRWNRIAIDATGLDHTPVAPGENRIFGEQLGPGRSSRGMAIVHIAIFDAVNAVLGGYHSYTGVQAPKGPMSLDGAVAQAAHDTLSALFPSQALAFDSLLAADLNLIKNKNERANAIVLGHGVAAALLLMRSNDGAEIPEPHLGINYSTSNQPGHWR